MRPCVLLALLALPVSLASHDAADEPGIYGYVLAPGAIPVSNGTVVYSSLVAPASTSIDRSGRSEATATIIGEALLEGVGTRPGILTVTAPGFQATEERLPEPPGISHDVALVPLPATGSAGPRGHCVGRRAAQCGRGSDARESTLGTAGRGDRRERNRHIS